MTPKKQGDIKKFTLRNSNGMTVDIINFGATITAINVPDRSGKFDNVVLGFKNPEDYRSRNHHHFGGVVGRVSNRIKGGEFFLEGKKHKLAKNNGENHLHGGNQGFDKAVWNVESSTGNSITLTHASPDGDEGYPGRLQVKVKYTLNDNNELSIKYEAHSDAPTPVNLTNHSYFNLNGGGDGTIANHLLQVNAAEYTPVDRNLIPTGIERVDDTPLDLRRPKFLADILSDANPHPQLSIVGNGLDHNFVLPAPDGQKLRFAARVVEPESGRTLEVKTTEPGVQIYTGNSLDGSADNSNQAPHTGVCVETQHFPDSVNRPEFPSVILRPNETYTSETVFRFSVQKTPERGL